ncbi:SAM-dependent methyltransferase [Nocardia sp. NBC_00565]|uniref:class I SAM-dependent methyltransferase n=1 Tax=Nocardia sp. NBC_00565 TaxID=2975993 RepID=UPI002E81E178|nr:SAM-dependent methyltransferase [Nocardia sp. NBC_00565]WUC00482.1 SAM-dependent methyltransferase [Nocardia sp. NBC_00565]
MAETAELITNVSDTARWVAAYRAVESARPDALFHDPLADRVAGERGRAIVGHGPRLMHNGWNLITRTKLIDDLIMKTIAQGCDRVLNMAAGMDTRPYRLDLPSEFPWIEADLPELVAEKNKLLAGESPRCALTRTAVDLADPEARRQFLDEALAGARRALVLTEGLVYYLTDDDVVSLAAALNRPEIAWWAVDVNNQALVKRINKSTTELLASAPWRFGPVDPLGFFADLGWTADEVESLAWAAHRYHRLPWFMKPFTLFPQPDPRKAVEKSWMPWSSVVRLTRTAPSL